MCNGARIMRLERPQDLERLAKDSDQPVTTTYEYVFRSRTEAAKVVALVGSVRRPNSTTMLFIGPLDVRNLGLLKIGSKATYT